MVVYNFYDIGRNFREGENAGERKGREAVYLGALNDARYGTVITNST